MKEEVFRQSQDDLFPTSWCDIVTAFRKSLGDRAGERVVHFAVDVRETPASPDPEFGILADSAFEAFLYEEWDALDSDELMDYSINRAFFFDIDDPSWICARLSEDLGVDVLYLWVDGKLCGGSELDELTDEDPVPFPDELPDELLCR